MKKLVILFALVVAGSAWALGQDGNTEQTIQALTEQVRQAYLKGDLAAWDKLLVDDFIGISYDGTTGTKAASMENFRSGKVKYDTFDISDTKVRVYGDTALVNTTAHIKWHFGATNHDAQYRNVRVWVKRNGQWQSVSNQFTQIAQQP